MTFKSSSEKFCRGTPFMALVGNWQAGRAQLESNELVEKPEFFHVAFPVCCVIQKRNDIQK
jgi:hypothetical protein